MEFFRLHIEIRQCRIRRLPNPDKHVSLHPTKPIIIKWCSLNSANFTKLAYQNATLRTKNNSKRLNAYLLSKGSLPSEFKEFVQIPLQLFILVYSVETEKFA
jgi:hypothetical protein